MDLDLRKLRYFVAVAELQHFGRAAESLFIAQPVLSRQIQSLERDLGCGLFERTSRSVALTPAGEQLLTESRGLFTNVDSALRRVHEVHRGVERLVVAFTPGLHVSDAVRAFTTAHPGVNVELMQLNWWEQDAPLRDGRADVGYLRRPFDETGLITVPIGTDTKVACLPLTHRLARRKTLTTADLQDEVILDAHSRRTSSVEEKFELIAVGQGIALVPRTVAQSYPRSDLVYLPVVDLDAVETCLAVPKGRPVRRVRDFVDLAQQTLKSSPAQDR